MRLFRRGFLILLGLFAVAGFALQRWWSLLEHMLSGSASRVSSSPEFENPYTREGKALISMVGGGDVEGMVRRAVELLGGWELIGVEGRRVLVKPNVVAGDGPPTTTNPEVVRAAVKSLYAAGAAEVFVGDMSALMTLPTRDNMRRTGIESAAVQAGAKVLCFEEHGWREVKTERARHLDSVFVSEWVFAVDRVVNLPVVKTHRSAVYTAALKNFVGATHGEQRPYLVDSGHWEEVVAELNLAYVPHLNLVDATSVMVADGPWHGPSRSPNMILASGDRIAADLAGLSLIKHYGAWPYVAGSSIWSQGQIERAVELGLGIASPQELRIRARPQGGDESAFAKRKRDMERFMGVRSERDPVDSIDRGGEL